MKTIRIAGFVALLFMGACNNAGEGDGNEDTTSTNITPVENVNGNIPDTSNSINLDADDTASGTQDTVPR